MMGNPKTPVTVLRKWQRRITNLALESSLAIFLIGYTINQRIKKYFAIYYLVRLSNMVWIVLDNPYLGVLKSIIKYNLCFWTAFSLKHDIFQSTF